MVSSDLQRLSGHEEKALKVLRLEQRTHLIILS